MRGAPQIFIQLIGIRVCNDNSSDQLSLWFKTSLVQVTSLQSNSQNIKGRYYTPPINLVLVRACLISLKTLLTRWI